MRPGVLAHGDPGDLSRSCPAAQKTALDYAIKVPLVYTNVFIRRWTAFQKLGVQRISTPAMWHTSFGLDFPVSSAAYKHQTDPAATDRAAPVEGGVQARPADARAASRRPRASCCPTSFDDDRAQHPRSAGPRAGGGGFDPARDILGITVNRWPHGYAYQYNSLDDAFWLNGGEQPCAVARRPFGRITIANSDSAAYAYTDAAIDHGHRAATELLNS